MIYLWSLAVVYLFFYLSLGSIFLTSECKNLKHTRQRVIVTTFYHEYYLSSFTLLPKLLKVSG